MRGVKAKKLRKRAKSYMCQYMRDLLVESLTGEENCDTLIASLPVNMKVMKRKTLYNGVATQRWWYRMVKKHPDIWYNDMIDIIEGK